MGLGFVAMLIGTGIFLTGQFLDTRDKQKAKRFFLLPGAWILLFIPMAFCFNTLMGLKGGGLSWWIAPIPMSVHSTDSPKFGFTPYNTAPVRSTVRNIFLFCQQGVLHEFQFELFHLHEIQQFCRRSGMMQDGG